MTIIAQRPEGEKWKYTITRFLYIILHIVYNISLKVDYGKFDTLNPKITSKITKNHLIGQQRK